MSLCRAERVSSVRSGRGARAALRWATAQGCGHTHSASRALNRASRTCCMAFCTSSGSLGAWFRTETMVGNGDRGTRGERTAGTAMGGGVLRSEEVDEVCAID